MLTRPLIYYTKILKPPYKNMVAPRTRIAALNHRQTHPTKDEEAAFHHSLAPFMFKRLSSTIMVL